MPKSNREYWRFKLERNVKKFINDKNVLVNKGWKVFVVWECEIKKPQDLEAVINNIFS